MSPIELLYVLAALVGLITFVEAKRDLIAKALNRTFFDFFDDVVMDEWNEIVDVKSNGDMVISATMKGHVNFDMLSEKKIEVVTETPYDKDDICFWARNEKTGERLEPIFHVYDKHYKQVGIPIGNVGAKQKFVISFGYLLPKQISFKRAAYRGHPTHHNERMLRMTIRFEKDIVVSPSSIRGEETTCGGVKKPVRTEHKPMLISNDPPVILFELPRASKGSTYEISWNAQRNQKD